jgi:sugar porter (SP) family MFS transporter
MRKDRFIFWSLVIALGGFLFGLDIAVISGAEKGVLKFWNLNSLQQALTISIGLVGAVIGSVLGALPADHLGRKTTLYIIGVLYLSSSLGCALTNTWPIFLVFRCIGGVAVGASSVVAPVYISEISPANKRGRLVALFQFNIVLGILLAYLLNYLISEFGNASWRLMLSTQILPSILFIYMLRYVPESPRWLILKKKNLASASQTLQHIDPVSFRDDLHIIQHAEKEAEIGDRKLLFSTLYRTPVILVIMFAFFNQVSGINAIIYYSPRIFELTGLGSDSFLLSTAGIGVINFLFTLLAISFIDHIGRKMLMLIGTAGLIITLGLVSFSFYQHQFHSWSVPIFLFIYVGFFAFSQGAVIWVFMSEIFPNSLRARGQTIGSTTYWLMTIVISFAFPYAAEHAGGGNIFLFFSLMMSVQLIFVWKLMPETKGRTLEQIAKGLLYKKMS